MRRSEQTERCIVGICEPGKADADDLRTKSSLGLPSRSRSVDCLRVQLSQCETRAAALAVTARSFSQYAVSLYKQQNNKQRISFQRQERQIKR